MFLFPGLTDVPRRIRRRWLGALVAGALLIGAGTVVWRLTDNDVGLAGQAVVTASSTQLGFSARDVVTSGSADSPGAGWQSNGQTTGAWIQLSWSEAYLLRRITLVRNPVEQPGVTDGYLSFSDGSYLQVRLSHTSRVTVIPITPRLTDSLRFTASAVSGGADNVFVAEIMVSNNPGDGDVVVDQVPDGNAALSASATTSAQAQASDPRALRDGSGGPGAAGVGADWTVDRPIRSWVELKWLRPRELSSIQVVGDARSSAGLSSATLSFSDGSSLPIGAVLADPSHPTTVSFMPRVTESVRLTIDGVSGTGPLSLAELRAYDLGATPVRSPSIARSGPQIPESINCSGPMPENKESALVVQCPLTGSAVEGRIQFHVAAAPNYSSVSASVLPANRTAPAGPTIRAALGSTGTAAMTVDVNSAPPGPLTIAFKANGHNAASTTVFFQLYRRGENSADDVPSSAAARGRTLVYGDEFNEPFSVSRTGLGADYAGAKPEYDGAENFGSAAFPNDVQGFHNVRVVDKHYLRIDLEPTPIPLGRNEQTFLSGLLASARPGGSGFSAQYGYFEARMLAPAAPGTWPAFWMLPSDNLVAPTPVVAEVDAVELYGHEPLGACESTHQYKDGKDGGVAQCGQRFATERDAVAWHTYGVSLTPTTIDFYIDGNMVATAPQVEGGGAPMFFLVNLALGGGWPIDLHAVQDRAALYVDYIRVYV